MEHIEFAELLAAAADDAAQAVLLKRHADLTGVELARALKDVCSEAWRTDPVRAASAASALTLLTMVSDEPEVSAQAAWTAGYTALTNGQMQQAIVHFDAAETRFKGLGEFNTAAATQVLKLYPLAMLGRYDEALECGLRAREVFLAHGDTFAAGKIEHNLGNIYQRRDRYDEAEKFLRAARKRYVEAADQDKLALLDNSLANALSFQHKFRAAEQLYQQALARAEGAGLIVVQAEIESNLGNFALFQGRYDYALDCLERSRRKYAALGMRHQSAIAEQEMADAYLELNLAPEAAAIYAQVTPTFAELGMRADQARALAHHGRACLLLGHTDAAHTLLAQAHALYAAEGSAVGEATVTLIEAQLYFVKGDYVAAGAAAIRAEDTLAAAGTWGRLLLARWLRGETARMLSQKPEAQRLLEATLRDAELQAAPQIALRCHTSLGALAAAAGDRVGAEDSFKRAASLIEEMRAPLPAEDFRTAFVTDKLAPYVELMRLCLTEGGAARVVGALSYVERARARVLADIMGGAIPVRLQPRDSFEADLLARLDELRGDLNWFYSQINRPPNGERSLSAMAMQSLHEAVRERESTVMQITRQLQLSGQSTLIRVEPIDIAELQRDLGPETALVEYTSLDGELLAFVVTNESVEVVQHLGSEEQVTRALGQLRFQLGALRHGAARMRAHLPDLTLRARHYLGQLYDLLLRPIEELLGNRRLVVVPYRALHYIPFHALYDGRGYVIERCEVCYAPSASVLRQCLAQPRGELHQALLLGVPDAQIPRVRDEITALAPLFPAAVALLDEHATLVALHEQASAADVLHLACHGQFRPDNPLFSSLQLADGWLTVRDASRLNLLNCGLVVLSACETGVSAVAPGDELLGLARGFFSAGAPSLMLSLWAVDDEATAILMTDFYTRLQMGDAPAAALRYAQCKLLQNQPHPFFWSPFMLVGRW